MIRALALDEANEYLRPLGFEIGSWNQIASTTSSSKPESAWSKYRAPEHARQLFCFSRHVAGWLPSGKWAMLQIDNSTVLDADAASLLSRLLAFNSSLGLPAHRRFLFEYGHGEEADSRTALLIANVVFALLLFEAHAYLVSANSTDGQLLGIQDGFAYFASTDKASASVELLLRNFERDPLRQPEWVMNIIARRQEVDGSRKE